MKQLQRIAAGILVCVLYACLGNTSSAWTLLKSTPPPPRPYCLAQLSASSRTRNHIHNDDGPGAASPIHHSNNKNNNARTTRSPGIIANPLLLSSLQELLHKPITWWWQHRQQQSRHEPPSHREHKTDIAQWCRSGFVALSGFVVPALLLHSPLPCHALVNDRGSAMSTGSTVVSPSSDMRQYTRPNAEETFVHRWMEQRQQTTSATTSETITSTISPSSTLSSSHVLVATDAGQRVQARGVVLDEVWTLIDKYYIDRKFNDQDWKRTKQIYDAQLQQRLVGIATTDDNKSVAEEEEMKIVSNMVKTLGDKYSRLLNVQQYTAIQKYDLIGVGVTLMPDSSKGESNPDIIVGAPPIIGSAADRAGLQVGDKVVQVNGIPTKGRTAFDIIDQISENPNAKSVTMTIQSPPSSDKGGTTTTTPPRDVVMERQFQEIKNPIRYQITETRPDGTTVGFIRISEFNSLIKANLEDALKNLKAQGANAFVIDLRRNGGGAFQSAVEVSGLFFEDRVATYVVDGTTATLPFKTAKGQVLIGDNDPVALWVDGGSASASEVLAASLHDNCKAVIIGDKSFGKGLIQAVYGLKNGAGLVLTVAKYVTPNQAEIQGLGIQPDISGQNIVPSLFNLRSETDTSRVDFANIRSRLSSGMCATKL